MYNFKFTGICAVFERQCGTRIQVKINTSMYQNSIFSRCHFYMENNLRHTGITFGPVAIPLYSRIFIILKDIRCTFISFPLFFLFWNKNEKLFTLLYILTTALYKFFLSYPRIIFSIYTVQLNQNNFTNYFTERKRQEETERNNLGNKYASVQK